MNTSDITIKIIQEPSEHNPFIVIYKPHGLASAPLHNDDESVVSQIIQLFPQVEKVIGKKPIEHGLLHRLDTETAGILLCATTQDAYDALIMSQEENRFVKTYSAICEYEPTCSKIEGFPVLPNDCLLSFSPQFEEQKITVRSFFRPYGIHSMQVRPVTKNSGKFAVRKSGTEQYETNISLSLDKKNSNATHKYLQAYCKITKGYRHQVRCHLAWICCPVVHDLLYNPLAMKEDKDKQILKFIASEITFPHPLTGEIVHFELPQSLFEI